MIGEKWIKLKEVKAEACFAALFFFFTYNWCIGQYNTKAWQFEDALLVMQWKQIGTVDNFQILKFNKSDYFFIRRNLYIKYKFDESKEEVRCYYEKKLIEMGWKKKKEDELEMVYEKDYFTGYKNKKLVWKIEDRGNQIWNIKISLY